MSRVSQPGTLIRDRGAEWAHTTLPTIQLDLAEEGIVRRNSHLCPSLQHTSAHSFDPPVCGGPGGEGGWRCSTLRDCRAKSRSMPNVCWTASHTRQHHALSDLEGRGAPYRRRIPCQRRLRRPFRRTQTATCRALAPPCQIRDVKRAKR
jgi:hypothetical protein